jgi:hypothetical protein
MFSASSLPLEVGLFVGRDGILRADWQSAL